MRSKKMTHGLEKAPHRSLLHALGLTREEIERPLVGVVNAANEVVPGHVHLHTIAEAVKAGVRAAGGTPMEFPAIAVCDGLAMNHEGMHFSLPSREIIADSIEIMATAHPFDALVFIPNCDKSVPGMLMAMLRMDIPSIMVSGGPMLAGGDHGRTGRDDRNRLPRLRLVRGHVHGQHHELHGRDHGPCAAGQRHHPGSDGGAGAPCQARGHEGDGTAGAEHHPAFHRHPARCSQRRGRGHGPWRLHQHGAAPARRVRRGRTGPDPGHLRRGQPQDPQPVQALARRTPPHPGPARGAASRR